MNVVPEAGIVSVFVRIQPPPTSIFFSTTMIFWPHLAKYAAQIMPLCPAPITTPSYSKILAMELSQTA
jgi:hypothetical protein